MSRSSRLAPEILRKSPTEVVDFAVSFANDMSTGETVNSVDSTTITDVDGNTISGELTIDSSSAAGQTASYTFSSGTAGTVYYCTVTVTTSEGEVLVGVFRVAVYAA